MYSIRLQQACPSDGLIDAQWKILQHLRSPLKLDTSYYFHELREIENDILYMLSGGYPFRLLLHDLLA